jgi:hypothetical protein
MARRPAPTRTSIHTDSYRQTGRAASMAPKAARRERKMTQDCPFPSWLPSAPPAPAPSPAPRLMTLAVTQAAMASGSRPSKPLDRVASRGPPTATLPSEQPAVVPPCGDSTRIDTPSCPALPRCTACIPLALPHELGTSVCNRAPPRARPARAGPRTSAPARACLQPSSLPTAQNCARWLGGWPIAGGLRNQGSKARGRSVHTEPRPRNHAAGPS